MIDLKAIRAAAEAATPGPWYAAGPSFGAPLPKYINCVIVENEDGDADDICIAPLGCAAISTNDLTFIATANPAAILELLDRLEAAEKDAARYRWMREQEGFTLDRLMDKCETVLNVDSAIDSAMGEQK